MSEKKLKGFRGRQLLLLAVVALVLQVAKTTEAASTFDFGLDYPQSSWEGEERVIIEQGRNKSFVCRVNNVQFFDVVRIRLVQGNKSLIISDNGDTKDPFGSLNRYKVDFYFHPDAATVTLSYTGILGEDSGVLSCQKFSYSSSSSSSSSSAALLELIVLVPPTKVQMHRLSLNTSSNEFIEEPIQHGGILLLQQKEMNGIRCTASVVSSTRAPWVKLIVDGVEMELQKMEGVVMLPPTPPSLTSTPVLQELTRYESTATIKHTTDRPNPTHHGALVTCLARTDKIFENLRISATIVVRYQPAITCPVTSYEARNGDNVTMTCEVDSNPESRLKWLNVNKEKQLHHDKYFSFHSQPLEARERPSSSSSSSSSSLSSSSTTSSFTPSSVATTRKQVMMTITRIKESHFGTYALSAINELGRFQVELMLSKMASRNVSQHNSHKQADRPSKQPQSSRTLHRPKGYFRNTAGSTSRDWSTCKYFLLVVTVTTRLSLPWIRGDASS